MYQRILKTILLKDSFKGKALILVGARQTGKTTLLLDLLKKEFSKKKIRIFNCDNPTDREVLENKNISFLKQLIGDADIVFIDEGQKVEYISQTIKLLVDYYKKEKQIFITGSSSINLLNMTQEPLTGRKFVYHLYPLSVEEIFPDKNQLEIRKELPNFLIFGNYPEVVTQTSFSDKQKLVQEIASSYIYKDILELNDVKSSHMLMQLLKALALQIGSQVSYSELANTVGLNKKTVERYIDLLEKSFVIFRLAPFTKNKRREISKLKKIYFYDLGVRNTLINNFNFLENRNDVGALWENFVLVERLKYRNYHEMLMNQYFWRTYDGSEVDLVEEDADKLVGYEFKWGEKYKHKIAPKSFLDYPNSTFQVITRESLTGFIL